MLRRYFFCICLLLSSAISASESNAAIAIITVPKAGTYLLKRLMTLIEFDGYYIQHADTFWRSKELQEAFPKRILLIRDPRDVCISWIDYVDRRMDQDIVGFMVKSLPEEKKEFWRRLSVHQRLEYVIEGQCKKTRKAGIPLPFVFYPMTPFENMVDLAAESGSLLCRFEDLVGVKGGGSNKAQRKEILRILDFLGLEISEEKLKFVMANLFGKSQTFYKGRIGRWKKVFTWKSKRLFKKKRNHLLVKFGYEKNTWW